MFHLIQADYLKFHGNLEDNSRISEDVDGFNAEQLDFEIYGMD